MDIQARMRREGGVEGDGWIRGDGVDGEVMEGVRGRSWWMTHWPGLKKYTEETS